MLTPLRVYILAVLGFTVLIVLSPLFSEGNWGGGVLLIPLHTLLPAIIIEILLTLFVKKLPKKVYVILSVMGIFLSFYGTVKYIFWVGDIQTEVYLPKKYAHDYVFVIYDIENKEQLKNSYNLKRNRKLFIPENGILETSTKFQNSDLVTISYPEVFNYSEVKIEKSIRNKYTNKLEFPCHKSRFNEKYFYIISIGTNNYDRFDGDSILNSIDIDLNKKPWWKDSIYE